MASLVSTSCRAQAFSSRKAGSSQGHAAACRPVLCSGARSSDEPAAASRRQMMQYVFGAALGMGLPAFRPGGAAAAAGFIPPPQGSNKLLCEEDCVAGLDSVEMVTTASGLQYKDIKVGTGPAPPTGYQVVVHYVAMTPEGRVFDSSLDKGAPYDIRVGAGAVIAGLDEGMSTMRVGGLRRLYIPGDLAFPKGLASAAGRPRVPPSSPVVFDVNLLYIPGLEDDE